MLQEIRKNIRVVQCQMNFNSLLRLHDFPPVWWIGQLLKFLLRLQPSVEKELEVKGKMMGFSSGPVVGIHVRRTDKLAVEAQFHSIEEYMKFVGDHFRFLDILALRTNEREELSHEISPKNNKNPAEKMKRRVYLATDDPQLWAEAREKFPSYEFLGDQQTASSAQPNSRYSESSLHGVIMDIHFLSRSDYLVCTFSSQVRTNEDIFKFSMMLFHFSAEKFSLCVKSAFVQFPCFQIHTILNSITRGLVVIKVGNQALAN